MGKLIGLLLVLGLVVVCTGCEAPGMNKKLALADSASVVATATALDEADDFDAAKEKTVEVATGLLAFVDSGTIGDLPLDTVQSSMNTYLTNKGWSSYSYVVTAALTYVKSITVDTSAIGENNVLLIKAGLEGVIRQASRSKAEWATSLLSDEEDSTSETTDTSTSTDTSTETSTDTSTTSVSAARNAAARVVYSSIPGAPAAESMCTHGG